MVKNMVVLIDDPNELIDVCDQCLRASCWHGESMCFGSREAGLIKKSRVELAALGNEHPSNYNDAKLRRMGIKQ